MSSVDQYLAKAEDLKSRAQGDNSPITRALFESLAVNYLRLADYEKEHQLAVRQKAWNRMAREHSWCCECGDPIPSSNREMDFGANLCVLCYGGLNARLSRLHDLALADPDFHRITKQPSVGRPWPARSLRRSLRGALRFAGLR
jgi:RNA polymerase-binding transcription factor DksA